MRRRKVVEDPHPQVCRRGAAGFPEEPNQPDLSEPPVCRVGKVMCFITSQVFITFQNTDIK